MRFSVGLAVLFSLNVCFMENWPSLVGRLGATTAARQRP
ncbi:hypothetical protein bAD24_p00115 (plasmid) [Burkholderia sp. AD24]|nr:hypothetical protein bAD24_p00115 [Burkholderia sp. AD24]